MTSNIALLSLSAKPKQREYLVIFNVDRKIEKIVKGTKSCINENT